MPAVLSTELVNVEWPTNYDSLFYHTASTRRCIRLLMKCGIIKKSVPCEHNGCNNAPMMPGVDKYKQFKKYEMCFTCTNCGKRVAITTNSMLFGSPIHAAQLIRIIYDFVNNYTGLQSKNNVNPSYNYICDAFMVIRKCLSKAMEQYKTKLGDAGGEMIIEIDESLFSKKRKYNKGRRYKQRWVFGMVDRVSGQIRLFYVPDRKQDTLVKIIKDNINTGSTIYSDSFRSYWILADEGYNHKMVNHEMEYVDQDTNVHTNTIEGYWAVIKQAIRKHRGTQPHLLQFYLDEFVFRNTFLRKKHERSWEVVAKTVGKYCDTSM